MKFNIEDPIDFEFKKADNFQDLLESLKLKWVKINRGGPEKVEGVITEVNKDFVVLIDNQEIVRLSMFHIKNISYGVTIEKAEKEKSDNQASDKAGNQSNNQSKTAESKKQQSRQKVKIKR
jgi:spore coat protein B